MSKLAKDRDGRNFIVVEQYACRRDRCGVTYDSPIRLTEPPKHFVLGKAHTMKITYRDPNERR